KKRYTHGSYLNEKGQIQAMIAESAQDIYYHRAAVLEAARTVDTGSSARQEISIIKVRGAKLLHDVIDRAIQVHGALGVTPDTPLEPLYRRARYARIYDGPDETHRQTIAKLVDRDITRVPWAH